MKLRVFMLLSLLLPALVQAMTEQQLQQMMQSAQQMQSCFAKLDQSALQAAVQQGQIMQREIQALCRKGERNQALQVAMKFAQELANNKEVKALQRCGKEMSAFLPDLPAMLEEVNNTQTHICDVY